MAFVSEDRCLYSDDGTDRKKMRHEICIIYHKMTPRSYPSFYSISDWNTGKGVLRIEMNILMNVFIQKLQQKQRAKQNWF